MPPARVLRTRMKSPLNVRRFTRTVMKIHVLPSFVLLATRFPTQAGADVVTEWNAALSRCAEDSLSHAPHLVARAFAITHLAIREAIEKAQADRHHGSSMD